MFFRVFKGFLTLNSDDGVVFPNFKGKIVFGDPPLASNSDPPLERESLPPKTPQMRGTPGSARAPVKNAIF